MNFDTSTLTKNGVSRRVNRPHFRRGLAPLEMTILLPFLMLIMAAMIAFGYASTWKVKSEIVARDMVWRSRFPRNAHDLVQVEEWPAEAGQALVDGEPINSFEDYEVLSSPVIVGQIPEVAVSDILVYSRDVDVGESTIVRRPPVLSRLGEIDFYGKHPLLDSRFQVFEMGISNTTRRIPLIYEIGLDFILPSDSYQDALARIEEPRHQKTLDPLERDPDFLRLRGSAPDFYPKVSWFSSTDVDWVFENRIKAKPPSRQPRRRPGVKQRTDPPGLLYQIEYLPERMISATLALFRSFKIGGIKTLEEYLQYLQGLKDRI